MSLRTVILKLHDPGKGKRQVLDTALVRYNQAFAWLMARACSERSEITGRFGGKGRLCSALTLSKWVDADMAKELNQFRIQPMKDALKMDVGTSLAGYLRLQEKDPGCGFPGGSRWDRMLEPGYDWSRAPMRPLYFCRYDTRRSYCLMYDADKKRYYAKLYLLNRQDARIAAVRPVRTQGLTCLTADQEPFVPTPKETYLVLPLAFGKWQEGILQQLAGAPDRIRTARLGKKGNDYFLSLSIATEDPEPEKPVTWMGVCRGLDQGLYVSITHEDGRVALQTPVDVPRELNLQGYLTTGACHVAANQLVALAKAHGSALIAGNLSERGDKIHWKNPGGGLVHPLLTARDYANIIRIAGYKLQAEGLPEPVRVSASDIFCRCPRCHSFSQKNRFSRDRFLCTHCGHSAGLEMLGSLNLAGKLMTYRAAPLKIKVRSEDGMVHFSSRLLGLNLSVPESATPMEAVRIAVEDIRNTLREKVRHTHSTDRDFSLHKKLEQSEDLMDLLQFET